MRRFFMLLVMLSTALGGCGDVDWFPEQGVSQFSFDTVTGVAPGSTVTSNTITVETRNDKETITISGGEYRINSEEFTSASGTVQDGDQVTVRHQASDVPGESVDTVVRIGDKQATFTSITAVPVVFDQPLILNAAPGTDQESSSETVTVPGGGRVPISVTGGAFSIDGGAPQTSATTIGDGQTVRVQHQSAPAGTTGADATRVTVLTIGEIKSTFASSVTGVATTSVAVTPPAGATEVIAEGYSLVSGTFPVLVQDAPGLGQVSVDGEEFWDVPARDVELRPGQPIYLKETVFPNTTVVGIGDRQVINFVISAPPQ